MIHPVRCPRCHNLSRVETGSLGRTVSCPHCGRPFAAAEEPTAVRPRAARPIQDSIPVVQRTTRATHAHDDPHHTDSEHGLSPALLGLILVPLGIPLLWLMAPLVTAREPVFSFAAPVAIAVSVIGLGLGVGFAHRWSHTTRVVLVLLLALMGYGSAGFLFVVKKEWAAGLKRHIGPPEPEWREFKADDKSYRIDVPGHKEKIDTSPVPGWSLTGYRFSPDRRGARDLFDVVYVVAHGAPPADVKKDQWLAAAEEALKKECDGEFVKGVEVTQQEKKIEFAGKQIAIDAVRGQEYTMTMSDGVTNRVVRVYKSGSRVYYLAAEGPFLSNDASYVKKFFNHFKVLDANE